MGVIELLLNKSGQELLDYKDLGWQEYLSECKEIANCVKLGHYNHGNKKYWEEFDNSLNLHIYTYEIKICTKCKIIWHIYISD